MGRPIPHAGGEKTPLGRRTCLGEKKLSWGLGGTTRGSLVSTRTHPQESDPLVVVKR